MSVRARARAAKPAALLLAAATLLASCAPAPRSALPPAAPAPGITPAPLLPSPPPPPAPANAPFVLRAEPQFDIGLGVDLDSLRLEGAAALPLSWRAPGGEERTERVDGAIRIRISGTQAVIEPLARSRAVPIAMLSSRDTLWVGDEHAAQGNEASIQWNGRHWRGRFKVFFSPRGRLTVASRMALERYLEGVVPGEIGALKDSLLEAGRAQAIAARSYSLFYRGRRGSEGFDLYATVEDQMYLPLESERPPATRCVRSTRGQTELSGGAPIRANYCSTCGGISAEAWEAWPTPPQPYLRAIADRGVGAGDHCALSPQYRWREEWSAGDFAGTVTRFAPQQGLSLPSGGLGELADVQVSARSRSGRVWALRVVGTRGEITIPAYSIRQVLRRPGNTSAILRSNLFKIGVRRDGAGRPLAVLVSGAGSGHGVGLCQTGALAMARGGADAPRILAHYYPSAELVRLY